MVQGSCRARTGRGSWGAAPPVVHTASSTSERKRTAASGKCGVEQQVTRGAREDESRASQPFPTLQDPGNPRIEEVLSAGPLRRRPAAIEHQPHAAGQVVAQVLVDALHLARIGSGQLAAGKEGVGALRRAGLVAGEREGVALAPLVVLQGELVGGSRHLAARPSPGERQDRGRAWRNSRDRPWCTDRRACTS